MANDLKRVGLVFKADGAVDFIKTNQSVNAVLRENYQQFKLVQTQWTESTKTSEKLADKLNYLRNAYDIQADKVRLLKTELNELQKDESASTAEIDKKKASLKQAEAELSRYGSQVEKTASKINSGTADLEDFSKKLDKTSDDLKSAGKKMSVFTGAYTAATGLAIKSSVDFESSIAGVAKTFPGTQEQLHKTTNEIRKMAKEIPASTQEISAVAEAAGQLGIESEHIIQFTRTMIDLGEATNLSAEEGATTLAKFANITKMSGEDFTRLGSVIVALGNNFATTEADIANMAMNLGAAGAQVGMSQSDILALSTALSSVGLEAQAGGTAFSKVMVQMQLAVEEGGQELSQFAHIAGMTSDEFSKAFKEDASQALLSFIKGLSNATEQGDSAIKILDDMGIKETRLRDALLRSANASEIFSDAIELGSVAWEENTALTHEASTRYETTESQMKILKNVTNDLAISFGDLLLPSVQGIVGGLKNTVEWLNGLSEPVKTTILISGGLVAAIGPLLLIFGTLAGAASNLITLFTTTLVPMFGTVGAAVSGLIVPITAIIAVTAAFTAAILELWNTNDTFRSNVSEAWQGISELLDQVYKEIIEPIFDVFKDALNTLWDEAIKPLWDHWVEFIGVISTELLNLWTSIQPFVAWFVESFGSLLVANVTIFVNAIKGGVAIIIDIIKIMLSSFESIAKGVIRVFKGIVDFVAGVFTRDWSRAWNGIKLIVDGVANILYGIVKAPINLIIAGINTLIEGLNVFISGINQIKIPSWVPGVGGMGFDIGYIGKMTYLATGGDLLTGSAIVGEEGPELLRHKNGRTSVVPLTRSGGSNQTPLIDYDKLARVLKRVLSELKLELDDEGFVRLIDRRLLEVMS